MNPDTITIDPETLGGTPVFKGTRVPVESLFDHLSEGISLEVFLDDFPSVSRDQAVKLLTEAGEMLLARRLASIVSSNENFA